MISNKNTSECKLLDFTINDENTLFDDDEELNDTSSSNDEETLKEGSDEEKAYEYNKKYQ